jgi:DNA-binding Lrp family transcriptional regulator
MANKKVWRKALELGLDEKDARLLYALSRERKFGDDDIRAIAKDSGLIFSEVKERLEKLRAKKILLKDQVSILDQIRIWDGYYIALIKAAIKPPVIGMETKFPSGWALEDYLEGLQKVEKKLGLNLIRHAYALQGTEWDILLMASATSQAEFAEFLSQVARQGWVTKTWSFIPIEYGEKWIFDPVASPDPNDYKTEPAKDVLWKKK